MFNKIHVLMINKFLYLRGGSERYFFSLSDLLTENGLKVSFFSVKDTKNFKTNYENYFINPIDFDDNKITEKIRYALNAIYSKEANQKLKKLLHDFMPHIAHLHLFHHHMSPSIIRVLKENNIPVIYTAHDLKLICPNYKMLNRNKICEKCKNKNFYNCFLEKCIKNSLPRSLIITLEMYIHNWLKTHDYIDIIITPSKFYRAKFIEYGFDQHKIKYIPNFLNLANFEVNYNHDNYYLYIGRLSEEKGLLTLINAAKKIKSHLIIAGTGPLEDDIRKKIISEEINNVSLVGHKNGDELKQLLRYCKFVVVPSEWYENAPYSILEANAYGKPVIGSNIGGIPEMIDDGRTGLLFEPGNSEMLADRINYLFNNTDKVVEFGKEARRKVELNNNKERHYEQIMEIYKSLL